MTLSQIDQRLSLFPEYWKLRMSFPNYLECWFDYKRTGFLIQSNCPPTFDQWLVWEGREDLT